MTPRILRVAAAAMALTLGEAAAASAHELGKGQVVAGFTRGSNGTLAYAIEVAVDPSSIAARLGVPGVAAAETCGRFVRHVEVAFDDTRSHPRCEYGAVRPGASGSAASVARMRLTGTAPHEARVFRWKYDLMYGAYPLVVQFENDPPETEWLQGPQTSTPVPLASRTRDFGSIAGRYFKLGFTHILPGGLDHVLFVAGLFFLGAGLRSILVQVTAFTVAHSITLALTLYGWVEAPASVVEPLIALSIVYVAVENMATRALKPWRVALVFTFGLLHGMGFAGVLRELGLPRDAFAVALAAFNGGVEAGQLTVIALLFLSVAVWCQHHHWYRRRVIVPASMAIAIAGAYWMVVRIM